MIFTDFSNGKEEPKPIRTETSSQLRGPLFVGGASRSGTTLMARLLNKVSRDYAFLPVEGWLFHYITKYPIASNGLAKLIVRDYLTEGRAMDTKRKQFGAPIDFFRRPLDELLDKVPVGRLSTPELLSWLMEAYCEDNHSRSWGIKDTYIEYYYKNIIRLFPGSQMLIMIRDPRASICSELYLGTFPDRNRNKASRLSYRLALWCLSADLARTLEREYPGQVLPVRYEDLVVSPGSIHERLTKFINEQLAPFENKLLPPPFSSYEITQGGFYDSNEKWRGLLTEDEIKVIEGVGGPLMRHFGYERMYPAHRPGALNVYVGLARNLIRRNPVFAHESMIAIADPSRLTMWAKWFAKLLGLRTGLLPEKYVWNKKVRTANRSNQADPRH
ncbi:MAG: sulfotransferase [Proteobacteria bacterium]|nr:sulfotransferase [Pseudomonadota bacterium]